ncbi:hypothetical protein [Geoglobus acetivorans]|uniref:Uncharacterized protein n=1 Tax=Geoglobus acetivorans TaxID=565033 RepID=A0A0A7GJH2_GEOAI|nr:hypothetical protein GACE_2047 [Geoglobus acetivorans]
MDIDRITLLVYILLVVPVSITIHTYGCIKLLKFLNFDVESVNLNRVGLPLIYLGVFWLISVESYHFRGSIKFIAMLSEIIYIFSFPIALTLIYYTLKEKKIESDIIHSPIPSLDGLTGISMSLATFSLAVLMKLAGDENAYEILEGFSLILFVFSAEIFRRAIFKFRKIV